MTEQEYHAKRELYATSNAPIEVIDEAIKKLDAQWESQQQSLAEGGEIDDIN